MTTPTTQLKVTTAMVQARKPCSIGEIANRTGLSYNSVKRALFDLDAKANDEYPVLYTLPSADEIAEQIERKGTQMVVNYRRPKDQRDWLDWYSRVLVPAISNTKITPESDPRAWANTITKLGELLLSMARDIHEYDNDPEWFQHLGGIVKADLR